MLNLFRPSLILFFSVFSQVLIGQERLTPSVPGYGGVFNIQDPDFAADPAVSYQVVVDVQLGPDSPCQMNPALHNVARLMNLHALAGIDVRELDVVLAIHGDATYVVMDDQSHYEHYGCYNPNTSLLEVLHDAGVKSLVCGQSLIARKVDRERLQPGVGVAVSMLTTVTTFDQLGYTLLRF